MIYTVTFNPSLDYIVSVDDFKLGLTNRTSSQLILPGGKGLNVSMLLGNLGIENIALGFEAGFTGKEIIRRIEEMGVRSDFISISDGISRINLKLKSIDGTEINGCVQNQCSGCSEADGKAGRTYRKGCISIGRQYSKVYAR